MTSDTLNICKIYNKCQILLKKSFAILVGGYSYCGSLNEGPRAIGAFSRQNRELPICNST